MLDLLLELLWSKTLSAPSFGRYCKQLVGNPYCVLLFKKWRAVEYLVTFVLWSTLDSWYWRDLYIYDFNFPTVCHPILRIFCINVRPLSSDFSGYLGSSLVQCPWIHTPKLIDLLVNCAKFKRWHSHQARHFSVRIFKCMFVFFVRGLEDYCNWQTLQKNQINATQTYSL